MYESLVIKNFRGFKELKIDGFKRINLISGKNDVGKTALLEALFLNAGNLSPQLVFNINAFRGLELYKISYGPSAEMPWDSLFYELNSGKIIELNAIKDGKSHNIKINSRNARVSDYKESDILLMPYLVSNTTKFSSEKIDRKVLDIEEKINGKTNHTLLKITPSGIVSSEPSMQDNQAYFVPSRKPLNVVEEAELFSKLDLINQIPFLVEKLRIIDQRLTRLSIIYVNDQPIIHGDIGIQKMLPIQLMGEGLSRLLSYILRISNIRNGIILIDEIENGIHYTASEQVWSFIDSISKMYNVQVFATTHSYECLRSAKNAFMKSDTSDFAFFRLERTNDTVTVKSMDKDTFEYAIETDTEVR